MKPDWVEEKIKGKQLGYNPLIFILFFLLKKHRFDFFKTKINLNNLVIRSKLEISVCCKTIRTQLRILLQDDKIGMGMFGFEISIFMLMIVLSSESN